MTRPIIAVIPASGIGSRMQAEKPKQYLQLKGKTILEHTVSLFLEHPQIKKVIVAISKDDPFYSKIELLKSPKVHLVFGGKTRAESVFNALKQIKDENTWVLVHDAVRPCLKRSDLDNLLQIENEQGGILAIPAVDTIKRSNDSKILHTEDRSTLWHALTPQFFPVQSLKQALESAFTKKQIVTDEASAMELSGHHPQLVAGRRDNLKITHPEDLALAEFYLTHHLEK